MINVALKPQARRKAIAEPLRAPKALRRRAALARYQILDTGSETDFDNIAMLASRIFGTAFAAISFIDDERQWFKAERGLGISETPIEQSFCAFAIRSNALFLVKDARRDVRFRANPLVTGSPHIRFYAGMRIVATDGTPIASLCVLDAAPRPEGITEAQRMTLQVLAAQVQSLLELRLSVIEQRLQVAAQSALSKKLRYVAEHDELTGLPHRSLFQRRLSSALREAERDGKRVAVMLVDVDHFKQINDSLGHDVGDLLLCNFAERLRRTIRSSDIVSRLGGDEFGIVLTGIDQNEQVAAVVHSLTDRLHEPIKHKGRMVDCRASIGVAVYPDHAVTPQELVKCSDLALASAKVSRGCAAMFCPTMADQFEQEMQMLAVARTGLAENRIAPYYQPKLDLRTGRLVGFEALVRCLQRVGDPLLPETFAHAFADRELANQISWQMLTKILGDVRHWIDQGTMFGHVAINTCAADFHGDDFAERLLKELESYRIPPGVLEIEVTEGVFLGRGAHHVARALSRLSQCGIRIALDDFGTGFAALTHLKQFPVDILKIDRSFVAGIGKNPDDTAIVRALIGLGQSLGIETVAEGVETLQQAAFVKAHGCDVGQGFLYSHAGPARDVPKLAHHLSLSAAA
jgi:diguanylate cyclase (GGDEF)-like protein